MDPTPPQSRLAQNHTESALQGPSSRAQTGLEFSTPEELIRHDANATELPPSLTERLRGSVNGESLPPTEPWWRRLFRR